MKLKDILKDIEILDTRGQVNMDEEITNISYNSNTIKEDGLFIALKGQITDGHKYLKASKNHGAIAAIVEDFKEVYMPQIKVKNARKLMAKIAENFYGNPSKDLKVIGITGTNGKTTTAFMVNEILKAANKKTGIIGTVYTKFNDFIVPSLLTTPESCDLQKYFKMMKDEGVEICTMEASSSAQEAYRTQNIDFDIVTFNNLSREHIDQHGSFENYFKAKSKLILEAKKDAYAILNMDNEKIASLKDKTEAKVLGFSMGKLDSDFGISNIDLATGFGKFTLNINRDIEELGLKKSSFDINLGTIGYSSIMNAVVAIIIALILKIPQEIIQKALFDFKGVERRFELIYNEKFKILDDHFANEKNIDSTMETISKMKYKNFHILYAVRGNRGVELNRENAERLSHWIKILKPKTFYASLSRDTVSEKDRVRDEELEVYKKVLAKNNIESKCFENLEDGICEILKNICSDDVLLLAGCQGMDKGAKFVKDFMLENNLVKDKKSFINRIDNRIC